jgi:hypothetical protein
MGFPNLFGGKDIYVSPPAGADLSGGTGTLQDPLHSVEAGIEMAAGGGTVHLRGGVYIESVEIAGVCGSWLNKIVVRPYKDEQVTIDSLIRDFLEPTDAVRWEPVAGEAEEYV